MTFRPWMESLWQDSRYAWRQLWNSPGFTAIAVATLALGVGVNTSIFTLLNALLLRPLPVPEPSRVVSVFRGDSRPASYPDFLDLRERVKTLSGLAADVPNETALDAGEQSEVALVESVSYNYAAVLGVRPALGRWFTPGEERTAPGEFIAVISHRLWRTRFGGDPGVLGKQVRMEAQPYTIVGVAAPEFQGMSQPIVTDLWIPLPAYARHNDFMAGVLANRMDARAMLIGRLKPGITEAQAQAELNLIDTHLYAEHPRPKPRTVGLRIETSRGVTDPGYRRSISQLMAVLMAASAMVLLIACANVGGLLLTRSVARRHEMAVRLALGASPIRIVRQTLIESLWLGLLGTAAGVAAAVWSTRLLEAQIAQAPLPIVMNASLAVDGRVLAFAFCVALLAAFAFGLIPALQSSRPALAPALKGEQPAGVRRHRWLSVRNLYVTGEIAVSLILLVVSGLFIRALQHAGRMDPGFDASRLLSVRLYLPPREFSGAAGPEIYDRILRRLGALPGVQDATLSYASPFLAASECVAVTNPAGDAGALTAGSNTIGKDYFRTTGIPLISGRDFTSADTATAPPVVIVNDVLAKMAFGGNDPVGRRVRVGRGCERGLGTEAEIAGVARDARYGPLDRDKQPFVMFPVTQRFAAYIALLLRTNIDPASLVLPVRDAIAALDRRVRVYEAIPLAQQMDKSLWQVRWEASLLAVFGGLALVLAAVGLYGVIASAAGQRTREIGIRMAIGARRLDVLRVVLSDTLGLTLAGIILGVAASLAFTRLLRGFLYGLSPADTLTFGAAVVLWAAVAAVAAYVPARRATRIDPVRALRHQ